MRYGRMRRVLGLGGAVLVLGVLSGPAAQAAPAGTVVAWGDNADGQLGLGSTSIVSSPTLIPGDYRYRRIAGGFYHACAFTLASEAWCWGNNADGRLGDGSTATTSRPPSDGCGLATPMGPTEHGRR